MIRNTTLTILSLILTTSFLLAQSQVKPSLGGQFGLSFSIGTHTQRIGLIGRLYFQYDFIQLNIQGSGRYNFKSLGSREKGWEGHAQLGLTGAWGRRDSLPDVHPFINAIGNQTGRPYNLSYAYIFYFDQLGTSQNSGVFGFQVKNFRFYFENDFLAFQSRDKFRSGSVGLFYRWNDWQFALKNISFTGDPYAAYCPWIEDERFPSNAGYIDMTNAPQGNKSIGVLALQAERRLPLNSWLQLNTPIPLDQYAGVEIGVDAEQIRNFFQNKLIHDSKVLPINWRNFKNPHVPMVCDDGCPYTYHPGQKIRPAKFYFQTWLNDSMLY